MQSKKSKLSKQVEDDDDVKYLSSVNVQYVDNLGKLLEELAAEILNSSETTEALKKRAQEAKRESFETVGKPRDPIHGKKFALAAYAKLLDMLNDNTDFNVSFIYEVMTTIVEDVVSRMGDLHEVLPIQYVPAHSYEADLEGDVEELHTSGVFDTFETNVLKAVQVPMGPKSHDVFILWQRLYIMTKTLEEHLRELEEERRTPKVIGYAMDLFIQIDDVFAFIFEHAQEEHRGLTNRNWVDVEVLKPFGSLFPVEASSTDGASVDDLDTEVNQDEIATQPYVEDDAKDEAEVIEVE